MPLLNRSRLALGSLSISAVVEQFNEPKTTVRPSLGEFWAAWRGDRSLLLLTALIKADFQHRFHRGEHPAAAEYFERFPQLVQDKDRALSLIYEEFCLLEENQVDPSVSEFCRRYETWRDSLVSQLGYHRKFSQVVGSERPEVTFPKVGERFATYQLSELLGTGGVAHVFRATDDLGGRQVVLKVSPSVGLEPSILAQVEHRNIVPILTVAESPERGLRGICMPYRPGITLDTILEKYPVEDVPRRARFLADVLDLAKWNPESEESGWKDFPINGSYSEAVAWLGATLARALVYLHQREIYHRDIKPANILLAHKQGPLLFDFNLAHSPNDPLQAEAALKGGTLPYMAPEQLKAFLDPSAWDSVGAPADIYALGLVLRELLIGCKPEHSRQDLPLTRAIEGLRDRRPELLRSTRLIRPEIPPSLDAIILKCLRIKPADRYRNASELATDLRCFLKRQPPVFATSSSRLEGTINWVIRRRRSIGVAGLVVLGSLMLSLRSQPELTDALIQEGVVLLNSSSPAGWQQAQDHYLRLSPEISQRRKPPPVSWSDLPSDGAG